MAEPQNNPRVPDMTVNEMREWLRNWIGNATGQSPDSVSESTPMVELGLSSRDAVAMASDIEDLTGVTLTATEALPAPTMRSSIACASANSDRAAAPCAGSSSSLG